MRFRQACLAVGAVGLALVWSAGGQSPAHSGPAAGTAAELSLAGGWRPVPPAFSGLSIEYNELPHYEAAGPRFDRVISLITPHDGHPMLLRVGGKSADDAYWLTRPSHAPAWVFEIGRAWMQQLRALTARDHLRVMLDLNLAVHSPVMAASLAQAASRTLPPSALAGLAVGNEPDLYKHQPGLDRERVTTTIPSTPPHWSRGYSPSSYRRDYLAYAHALVRAAPGIPLAAPEMTSFKPEWMAGLLGRGSVNPRTIAIHRYASSTCWPRNLPGFPTIRWLLGPNAALGLAQSLERARTMAKGAGLSLRVTEFNSTSCGGRPGVTDSFATALWAPDALFSLIRAGVDGVNWHIRPALINAPFQLTADGILPRPELYGLALFAQMIEPGARLSAVNVTGSHRLQLVGWAVRSPKLMRVLILNKGPVDARIRLHTRGTPSSALLSRLLAPSITARTEITLGGQSIGLDGRWHGHQTTTNVPRIDGTYTLSVSGYSGALLTMALNR